MRTVFKNRNRQNEIHKIILLQGSILSHDICTTLNISLATVRRDLDALERRGLIERTWGGAKVRRPIEYLADFKATADKSSEAKRAIAAAASDHVEEGMTVGLSGGTTCTELARWLRGKPITVVTNAINVATELYNHSLTKVIVTGGSLNSYSYELIGEMVNHSLKDYKLDLCFVGCSGITPEFGFSMRDSSESAVAKAFMRSSEKLFVVADQKKIGKKTRSKFASLDSVQRLITNIDVEANWKDEFKSKGLEVEYAAKLVDNSSTSRENITPVSETVAKR